MIDHIYIINLERDVQRRKRFEDQIKRLQMKNYSFFKGVDLSEQQYQEYKKQNYLQSKGELGCLFSHINIYKDALSKNYNNILIFEDDIDIMDKNFLEKTQFYMKELNNEYDVILLGANHRRAAGAKIMNGLYKTTGSNGTFGYAICKDTMIRLINSNFKKFSYDFHWRKFDKANPLKFYCIIPHLVNVYDTVSSISNSTKPTKYAKQIWNTQFNVFLVNFKPPY